MKQTVEEAKIKKVKAEMEIARILENLELETGLKSNIVYVYRENAKSEPLSQPKECILKSATKLFSVLLASKR
ncbi:hypothetical protein, partial [Bacteroides sp. AF25-17LB]|uniref:hypothetical protein n=2 Tax=unclassified Bacteroides TaxID=2646097 RepID=UPI000EE78412